MYNLSCIYKRLDREETEREMLEKTVSLSQHQGNLRNVKEKKEEIDMKYCDRRTLQEADALIPLQNDDIEIRTERNSKSRLNSRKPG